MNKSLLLIQTLRIDGKEYPQATARLYAECDVRYIPGVREPIPSYVRSKAEIQTLDPVLIEYLHAKQGSMTRITIEIERDGIIETARDLLIMNYDMPPWDSMGLREFKCEWGRPIETRIAAALEKIAGEKE